MTADVDVVVVGAGPVGLMLACELRLAGARPIVLERLAEPSAFPKANGLLGQIVRLLDYRGLLGRFSEGAPLAGPVPGFPFGDVGLDFSALDESPLHGLLIQQPQLERLLGERAAELGVEIRRGNELAGFNQGNDEVTLEVLGPEGSYGLRARYLVGCDGAKSFVRKHAGIGFPGMTRPEVTLLGHFKHSGSMSAFDRETGIDVPGYGRLKPGWHRLSAGGIFIGSLHPGVLLVAISEKEEAPADRDADITLEELRAAVRRVLGADLPLEEPIWLSRTVGHSRQADRYRDGRVFLAGDAAHLFIAGGASLNVGMLDAVNLAWKLVVRLRGTEPAGLLDSYHQERYPVGRRARTYTLAQYALGGEDAGRQALREVFGELLQDPAAVRRLGEMMEGSDIRYPMNAPPHPLLGAFAPDLPLRIDGRETRVAELLHDARPLLLDLADRAALREVAGDTAKVITAQCDEPPADALLIRPDGHIAWLATSPDTDADTLRTALTTWFGPGITEV